MINKGMKQDDEGLFTYIAELESKVSVLQNRIDLLNALKAEPIRCEYPEHRLTHECSNLGLREVSEGVGLSIQTTFMN